MDITKLLLKSLKGVCSTVLSDLKKRDQERANSSFIATGIHKIIFSSALQQNSRVHPVSHTRPLLNSPICPNIFAFSVQIFLPSVSKYFCLQYPNIFVFSVKIFLSISAYELSLQ